MTATLQVGDIVERLTDLLALCREGERGFGNAAELAKQPPLRRILHAYSKQRSRFANELQVEVTRLGGVVAFETIRPHWRSWSHASGSGGPDEFAIIAACISAEDRTVREYEKLDTVELPPPLRTVLDRQRLAIIASRDRFRMLRTAA
jgi:uncharacterized protein (TIGR02284 family)